MCGLPAVKLRANEFTQDSACSLNKTNSEITHARTMAGRMAGTVTVTGTVASAMTGIVHAGAVTSIVHAGTVAGAMAGTVTGRIPGLLRSWKLGSRLRGSSGQAGRCLFHLSRRIGGHTF